MCNQVPTLDEVGVKEVPEANQKRNIIGGETVALEQFDLRLEAESEAFIKGSWRPSQVKPDLLEATLSLSAAVTLGTLSVRLYN